MRSPICERAIQQALEHGKAIAKFVAPNDVGLTGSHQYGFYLPIGAWQTYSPFGPERGVNRDHNVRITWPDGTVTNSVIKWYGRQTRYEYRLTRFGRDFPWISWQTSDNVGDLLVLIPVSVDAFNAYIFDLEEDIDEFLAALDLQVVDHWAYYERGRASEETEDTCINKRFREFVQQLEILPDGETFSATTRQSIIECIQNFSEASSDAQLVRLVNEEYVLYKMAERLVFQPEIEKAFRSIDEFLQTANSILQARKSRAGRSLENHVEYLLNSAGIPFDRQPDLEGTKPDIVIPGKAQYDDPSFPESRIFVVGVKRTCKDRWRQVTREGPRIAKKHIITMQRGMSSNQIEEMQKLNVSLVVPEDFHRDYPPTSRRHLMNLDSFISELKNVYN